MIRFLENLTNTMGPAAGKPFLLRDWQKAIIRQIYDPVREDGHRMVRQVLITMPRKNGKTELAAGLVLYHLLADGERNGQVYSAAADRAQAAIVFNAAASMVRADPELESMVNIIDSTKRIVHYASGSVYQALSADARTKHGFNASAIIYDELAQAPNRQLFDVLTTSTAARAQPLTIVISTTSSDPTHVMSELVEYGKKVRDGVIKDPTFAPVIYQAPPEADPWDEAVWHACNPALGDFRSIDEMRTFAARAKRVPSLESVFRNLYLNQPVDADQRFLSSADWDAGAVPVDLEQLEGRPCFGGLDLSSTQDLTALVLVFPDDDYPPSYDVLAWFWSAGDTLRERGERDRVPYALWRDQGYLEAPPGRAIDKGAVVRRLAEVTSRFDVQGIAFDRWRIADLKKALADDGLEVPLVDWGQGFKDMAPAVDALETAVLTGRLRHGGHPVMRWNAANACITQDPAGSRKIDKARSVGRIDGLVALAMAIGLAERTAGPVRSPYEEREGGFLFL
ncbi:MAG: terminase large subunit [Methylacidiphilales bacterium]|nr:terminase large subunit [Candidatus Methylacidiphilales bacterium]